MGRDKVNTDQFAIVAIVILAVLFGGEPDIADAIIAWLQK